MNSDHSTQDDLYLKKPGHNKRKLTLHNQSKFLFPEMILHIYDTHHGDLQKNKQWFIRLERTPRYEGRNKVLNSDCIIHQNRPSTTFPSESVLQAFMRLEELSAE